MAMRFVIWFLLLAAVAQMFSFAPFGGEDISRLVPVELLVVSPADGGIALSTDRGLAAWGKDLSSAMEKLKAAASGTLFLQTVDQVVCTGNAVPAEALLACGLRSGTAAYLAPGVEDATALKNYLSGKKSGVTLGRLREEAVEVPALTVGESGLYLPEN